MRHMFASIGLDPNNLIRNVVGSPLGTIGLFLVIFAESGLMFGFFLPGDSLLFTAGLISVTTDLLPPLPVVMVGCFIAAVAGDQVGYWLGRKTGPAIFRRPDSRFFKQEYVQISQDYLDSRGGIAVTFTRFVPIVRAFAPVIVGVSRMNYRRFLLYDVIGAFLWVVLFTSLGALLGKAFPSIGNYLDYAILGIVALSLIPMVFEYRKHKRMRAEKAMAAETADPM
jgi:membrane-associated protein